jgi:hypothetical protein
MQCEQSRLKRRRGRSAFLIFVGALKISSGIARSATVAAQNTVRERFFHQLIDITVSSSLLALALTLGADRFASRGIIAPLLFVLNHFFSARIPDTVEAARFSGVRARGELGCSRKPCSPGTGPPRLLCRRSTLYSVPHRMHPSGFPCRFAFSIPLFTRGLQRGSLHCDGAPLVRRLLVPTPHRIREQRRPDSWTSFI